MQKGKQHISERATMRTSIFLQPAKAVRCFVAFFLAFSLFPVSAFADASSGSNESSQPTVLTLSTSEDVKKDSQEITTSATNSDVIEIITEPLNLIQNGNYNPNSSASILSSYATSTTASSSSELRSQVKAAVNYALENVEYSVQTVRNSSTGVTSTQEICIVDISDLRVPLTTSAAEYAKSIVEEVINDNPDLFYAGAGFNANSFNVTNSSGKTYTYIKNIYITYYYDVSKISSMKTSYNNALTSLLKWVPTSSTDAEKVKAVHDWIVRNCSYNTTAAEKGGPVGYKSWDPWTAYGALVTKRPVCQGYSLAFIAAMKRLGLQATFVQNAGHGWNRVYLNDKKSWFNVDVTWDDPLPDRGFNVSPVSTTHLLKSDYYFKNSLSGDYVTFNNRQVKQHGLWSPPGVAGTNTTYDDFNWSSSKYTYNAAQPTVTVSSITLSNTSLTISDNDSYQLKITPTPSNANVALAEWSTSNKSIVTVSSAGLVSSGSKAGTATITAKLGGKTATCRVTVKKATRLSSATVSLAPNVQQKAEDQSPIAYKSGTPHKPVFVVKVGSTTLKQGVDYTVSYPADTINPGTKTATITATASSGYVGSTTFNYTVNAPLSKVTKTPSSTINVAYTGAAQKKLPTLTFSGSNNYKYTLKQGTDFTVTWPSDMTNAGTKTVKITGRGVWTGTYSYKVNIVATDISKATISYSTSMAYTGKAVKPTPTVKIGGTTISSSNYTVSYNNNVKVGTNTATMTIKGRNNLKGSKTVKFSIAKTSGGKVIAATTVNSAVKSAKNNSWVKTSKGYVYKTSGSNVYANGWVKIGGKWYYFNSSGIMQTGWLKYKNKWYYLNSGGDMATGWKTIGGTYYFFVKSTGEMAANEWREGYWLNANGSWTYSYKGTWRMSSGKWWFGDSSGWYARSSTIRIDGKAYRFDSAGWCLNP